MVSGRVRTAAIATRALHFIGNAAINAAIVIAVLFLGWCVYRALAASKIHYAVTSGQHAYAVRYCVSELGGSLGSAYVAKPDLFGSTGPTPRLIIRCTFGAKGFVSKVVDLERSNETPNT